MQFAFGVPPAGTTPWGKFGLDKGSLEALDQTFPTSASTRTGRDRVSRQREEGHFAPGRHCRPALVPRRCSPRSWGIAGAVKTSCKGKGVQLSCGIFEGRADRGRGRRRRRRFSIASVQMSAFSFTDVSPCRAPSPPPREKNPCSDQHWNFPFSLVPPPPSLAPNHARPAYTPPAAGMYASAMAPWAS